MIKQKTIKAANVNDFTSELDIAIAMGWVVHSFACDSRTGVWVAVLQREAV